MKAQLAKGAGWIAGSRVLTNLLGLTSALLLARLLMPEDFGLVAIATAIAAIAAAVTELSLASALVQHRDPQRWHYDTVWTMGVLRSLLLGAAMAAMAWPVAAIYGDTRLFAVMLAFAAANALGGFGNPRLVMFTRELVFWQEFALGVSGKLVGFVIGITVAYVFRSYWALVAGMAATQLWALAMSYALKPGWPRFSVKGFGELFGYSVWLSLGQIVSQLNWRADQFLLGYFLGSGPLGHYSYGDNLAQLPTREATAPVAQTLFPAFSRMAGEQDRLRNAYQQAQSVMFAVALPLGVGFALVADPLVRVLLGEKWLPAVLVIQVLASVFAVQTMSNAVQPLAMAVGETRALFRRDLFLLVFRIPLIVAGLWVAGLAGVVFARVVSGLTGMAINMVLAGRILGLPLRRQVGVNARAIAAAAVMAVAVGGMQVAEPTAQSGLAGVSWLVGLVLTGGAVYGATGALLWLAAGRPPGPERDLLSLLVRTQRSMHRLSL